MSRAHKLIERARGAVPEGTFAVGAGLIVAALTSYGFIIVAFRVLGNRGSAGLSAFWALIFVAGPGFFLPLEQEVGRALAHRRAQSIGGGPLVKRAAAIGAILALGLVIATLALTGPLDAKLFHGEASLVVGLAVGLVGFFCIHTTRGTLSGNGRFRAYGEMMGSEGLVRLLGAVGLAIVGVKTAGAYGACLALAPFVSVLYALRKERGLLRPGPVAPYTELSNALGFLLAGSVLMQALSYAPLLGASLLGHAGDKAAIAQFTRAFFVARIPILLYQAVQGTLLPKLAALAGSGRHDDFRTGFRRLMALVCGIAALGTAAAFTIGPFAGKLLFGEHKFTITNTNLGLLALGSGAFIISVTMAQPLLALKGHRPAALAWLLGLTGFVVGTLLSSDLFLRVEIGFVIGSAVSAAVAGAFLHSRMHGTLPESIQPLIEVIEHEPLEI